MVYELNEISEKVKSLFAGWKEYRMLHNLISCSVSKMLVK